MELQLYQVDAFASQVFGGNPAAVVPLLEWLDESLLQSIAAENNLAETAFFVRKGETYEIRWFTPWAEVDLCGHATLASAYVLFNELNYKSNTLVFDSKSGLLQVDKIIDVKTNEDLFLLDFPNQKPVVCGAPLGLSEALGIDVKLCLENEIYIVVLDGEAQVASLKPNFTRLLELGIRGVTVTAPSNQYDFVNRYFAPFIGINEDSVTGSAFTKLIPYWAKRLNKDIMIAKQISRRGGEVYCELAGDRVKIGGTAVKYLQGAIRV